MTKNAVDDTMLALLQNRGYVTPMTPRAIIILTVITITSLMIPTGSHAEQSADASCAPSAYLTAEKMMLASPGTQTITWSTSCIETATSAQIQLVQLINRDAPYLDDPDNYREISTHTVDISPRGQLEVAVDAEGTLAVILNVAADDGSSVARAGTAFFATASAPKQADGEAPPSIALSLTTSRRVARAGQPVMVRVRTSANAPARVCMQAPRGMLIVGAKNRMRSCWRTSGTRVRVLRMQVAKTARTGRVKIAARASIAKIDRTRATWVKLRA